MNSKDLLKIFKIADPISDEIICSNSEPLFDLNGDVFLILPSYMAWCLNHDHSDGNIVIDGTISALSELGRSKSSNAGFKYECTAEQVGAILEFLKWSLTIDLLTHEYTERAIKQWSRSIR